MSTNHLAKSRAYKVRKALRYVMLYGLRRTIVKVRSQYHMSRRYDHLPDQRAGNASRRHVAIIGCGNFAYSNICFYLKRNYGDIIKSSMDIDVNRAASLFEQYNLAHYTSDASVIIDDDDVDLVYIVSNHASHADYAVAALDAGKSVHIEKPHVVSMEQLERLCAAMRRSTGAVGLGFNRPNSAIGRAMRSAIMAESGPCVQNWFVAGHAIPMDHWYMREGEGGRVLGNLCHWTDLIYHCVAPEGRYPITITPTATENLNSDIAVTFLFGDGSVAVLTFSEKGEPFEGVRERFSAQRGNTLVFMDDFQSLTIETGEKKKRYSPAFRDHGHEAAVRFAYEAARSSNPREKGRSVRYVWESGELFLRTKEALESGKVQRVDAYQPEQDNN